MKYSPKLVDDICEHLRNLTGRVEACKKVGISYQTFSRWWNNDMPEEAYTFADTEEQKKQVNSEFREKIKNAEDDARQKGKEIAIMAIFNAMPNQWQAAAWWLERNFKDEFAEKKTMDIHNPEELEQARKKLKDLMEELDADTEGQERQDVPTSSETPEA